MSKGRTRAGAQLLLMAADPVNRRILLELAGHPLAAGPGREYRVTGGGREALFVGFVIEHWLQSAPHGPLPFGSQEAEGAVAALADGWSATVMHALAREPLSLAELHEQVGGLSQRALGRHLATMGDHAQVEELAGEGEALYAMTDWLRAGIAPLIASARLERREPKEGMAPIDALDVEAGFRCALPLVELPRELSGSCRLGINLEEDDESGRLTGVTARIEQGRVVSCRAGLDAEADAWAAGSAGDWLDTVVEPGVKRVRTGDDRWLTRALLDALHEDLFGISVI